MRCAKRRLQKVIHVTWYMYSFFTINHKSIRSLADELAEPSCPQWVETAGFTNPTQEWCAQSWGFHIVRGGIDPVNDHLRPRRGGSCRCMGWFMIQGWDIILRGWRWLHESQLISNEPVGLGFPSHARRHRPGGSPFSSPVCWDRRIEIFLIRR